MVNPRFFSTIGFTLLFASLVLLSCSSGEGRVLGDGGLDAATGMSGNGGNTGSGAPFCGNGIIDSGEECDGANLGSASCESLNEGTGILLCSPTCTYDINACTQAPVAGYGG